MSESDPVSVAIQQIRPVEPGTSLDNVQANCPSSNRMCSKR